MAGLAAAVASPATAQGPPVPDFSLRESFALTGNENNLLAVRDMDNDGVLDVVMSNWSPGRLSILEKEGAALVYRFTPAPAVGTQVRAPFVAEVDGDATPELGFGELTGSWRVYESNGNNSYVQRFSTSIWVPEATASGDSDGDGNRELFVASEANPSQLLTFEAQGDNLYVEQPMLQFDNQVNAHVTGTMDMDGDGSPEMLFADYNTSWHTHITENGVTIFSDLGMLGTVLGDTDGDGLGEFMGNVLGTGNLRIYESTGSNNQFQVLFDGPKLGYSALDWDHDGTTEFVKIDGNTFSLARLVNGIFVDFYQSGALLQDNSGTINRVLPIHDTNGDGASELAILQGIGATPRLSILDAPVPPVVLPELTDEFIAGLSDWTVQSTQENLPVETEVLANPNCDPVIEIAATPDSGYNGSNLPSTVLTSDALGAVENFDIAVSFAGSALMGGGHSQGVIFGFQDPNNYYVASVFPGYGGSALRLEKVVNGGLTSIFSGSGGNYNVGFTWAKGDDNSVTMPDAMRIVRSGSQFELYTASGPSGWSLTRSWSDSSYPSEPTLAGFGERFNVFGALPVGTRFAVFGSGDSGIADVLASTGMTLSQSISGESPCGDETAPVVSITAPVDGSVIGSLSVDVEATVVDESETVVTSTPTGLMPAVLPEYMGTLALDVEGENVITVSATDDSSNSAATSVLVYRDTISPVVEISPGEGTVVSSPISSFGITVTDQTETEVNVHGQPAGTALVADGETFGVASTMLTGTILLWEEGVNTIVVEATDAAGNTTLVTRNVILDTTAPVVEIASPVNGACYGVGSDLEIPLSAEVNDATATEVSGALTGSLEAGGGTLMGTVTLVEGVNSISVTATNPGLMLVGTDTVSVTLDTIAPTVEIATPEDGACVRGTIEFHATTADVLPGTVDSSVFFVDGVALAAAELYTVDTLLLSEGLHELSVLATDTCGNETTTSVEILVDNIAPDLILSNPFDLEWVAGEISFDASATDGGSGLASITMLAANAAPTVDGSLSYEFPAAYGTASSLVDTYAASGGVDGEMEFEVTATDCSGNSSTVAVTVNVDNSAPTKAGISPADGSVVKCLLEISSEVSDENLASVQYVLDGVAYPVMTVPPFEMDYDSRERLDGDLAITLIATDLAGNVTSCTSNVTIDNLELKLKPRSLKLKSKGGSKSVSASIEGQSAALMLDVELEDIMLCVPGGSPIPATSFHGHDGGWLCVDEHHASHRGHRKGHRHGHHGAEAKVHVKFDRRLLIGSIRGAGHTSGYVEVTLKVTKDGRTYVIGTNRMKVKG
ncbi:MAG: hypothetical protein ACI8QC_002232 [Planctomycetota bacterium]|jgi:hypothetical protein